MSAPARLADTVTDALTASILDGTLEPGAPLPSESALAARFGVSKPVIREAIRQLAAQGVLQGGQGRATRVRLPDADPLGRFWLFAAGPGPRGLAEAVELRRMLEPAAARLAAQRRTQAQMDALHAALAAMHAARGNPERWMEADLAFHAGIAAMTQNRLLLLQMQGLLPVIRSVMQRFSARATRDAAEWDATWSRHAVVVDALSAADPTRAESAMLAHFAAADRAIAELFPHGPSPSAHER